MGASCALSLPQAEAAGIEVTDHLGDLQSHIKRHGPPVWACYQKCCLQTFG